MNSAPGSTTAVPLTLTTINPENATALWQAPQGVYLVTFYRENGFREMDSDSSPSPWKAVTDAASGSTLLVA
jgi:hypothetical protein